MMSLGSALLMWEILGQAGYQGWDKLNKESRCYLLHFSGPNTTPNHEKDLTFLPAGESPVNGAV